VLLAFFWEPDVENLEDKKKKLFASRFLVTFGASKFKTSFNVWIMKLRITITATTVTNSDLTFMKNTSDLPSSILRRRVKFL
jgi:hypothetical protein